MKQNLLLITSLALTGLLSQAETKVYLMDDLGEINGVSDNGRYAAVTDPDGGSAYLWSELEDGAYINISAKKGKGGNFDGAGTPAATSAMDVSDDGVVVGSILIGSVYHPAYYKDGTWNLLPLDSRATYTNEAVCITPDGSVIAGYQFIKDPASFVNGKYYPCQWVLSDDGKYTLTTYTDIKLPDHQGFFPLTQTADGKIIAGTVYCGFNSRINALIKDGELIIFEKLETRHEPMIWKGKYYAGMDEDGKQIWVDDINDPRVELYATEYINGYKDGSGGGVLEGFFQNCDDKGNFYGARSRVENVDEEGNGNVVEEACIYNIDTDEWHTAGDFMFFSAGLGEELIYASEGKMIKENEILSVESEYGLEELTLSVDEDHAKRVEGVNKMSADGRVLGAVLSEYNPAISTKMYYPFIIVTAEASAIRSVMGDPTEGLVVVTSGCIEVLNTQDIAVYDLKGHLVGMEKVNYVEPGVYVVKAGNASYKVVVK